MSIVKIGDKDVNITRVWELLANVDGPLEGRIDDWPAHIQDKIWQKMEALSKRVKLSVAIIHSRCDYDVDTGWYLDVWVSEIVAVVSETWSKDAIPVVEFARDLKGTRH